MGTLHIATVLLALTGTGETVLLDFQATWCAPCRQMDPHVERLAAAGYPVRKVDVDQQQDMVRRFQVQDIPCFVLLVNGQERGRLVDQVQPEQLEQLFTAAGVGPANAPGAIARGQSPDRRFFGGRTPRPSANSAPDLSVPRLQIEQGTLISSASTENPQPRFQPRPRPQSRPPVTPASFAAEQPATQPRQPARRVAEPRNPLRPGGADPFIDQLMAASVRLHVEDPDGTSHGSGTIVDATPPTGGEQGAALILTCAHIFRDSQGKGSIQVDLFENGVPRPVKGYLVRYDLEQDVALVSIYTHRELKVAPLAPEFAQPRKGDRVVSIGCPGGGMPTALRSQVLNVSSYGGITRIQATGQPEIGRSGGGLFNTAGQIIGVCNFADPTDGAGLYAAIPAAKQVFEDAGLAQIYQDATGTPVSTIAASGPKVPALLAMPDMPAPPTSPSQPTRSAAEPLVPINDTAATTTDAPAGSVATDGAATELICILRNPGNPQAPAEVIVIDQASRKLLQQIASERSARRTAFPTSKHSDRSQPARR